MHLFFYKQATIIKNREAFLYVLRCPSLAKLITLNLVPHFGRRQVLWISKRAVTPKVTPVLTASNFILDNISILF